MKGKHCLHRILQNTYNNNSYRKGHIVSDQQSDILLTSFFVSLFEDDKLPLYLLTFFHGTVNVNREIHFQADIKFQCF
jgi:hypothetical protein